MFIIMQLRSNELYKEPMRHFSAIDVKSIALLQWFISGDEGQPRKELQGTWVDFKTQNKSKMHTQSP